MQQLCTGMRADLQRLWRDPGSIVIHKGRLVGRGGTGVVYAAKVHGGTALAAKVIRGLHLDSDTIDGLLESGDRGVAALRRELVVMSRLPEGLDHICRCGWPLQLHQHIGMRPVDCIGWYPCWLRAPIYAAGTRA